MPHEAARPGLREPAEGPPSSWARAELSAALRREVADARARLEEAALRAQAHQLLGDPAAAAAVVREQEGILAEVRDRLGRVVSAAAVQREAERVLADVVDEAAPSDPVGAPERPSRPTRDRPLALSGAASMVAVLAVATAAVLGLGRGLDRVQVAEVSADATPQESVEREPAGTSPSPLVPHPGDSARDRAAASEAASTSNGLAPTTEPASARPDGAEPLPPTPTTPGLDDVVPGLVDAVGGLADPVPDPSEDVDASLPGLEGLVEDAVEEVDGDHGLAPDAPEHGGFVPGHSSE